MCKSDLAIQYFTILMSAKCNTSLFCLLVGNSAALTIKKKRLFDSIWLPQFPTSSASLDTMESHYLHMQYRGCVPSDLKIPWITRETDLSHPSHGCLMGLI